MATRQQSAPVEAPASTNGNRPIHTFRHRNIKATIWKNQTSTGSMYNVSIVRSWRNDQDEWNDSHSFGYDDLMNVSALMYEAHAFISSIRAKENAGQRQAPQRSSTQRE